MYGLNKVEAQMKIANDLILLNFLILNSHLFRQASRKKFHLQEHY